MLEWALQHLKVFSALHTFKKAVVLLRQATAIVLTDKSMLTTGGFYCCLKRSGHILSTNDGC